MLLNKVSIAVYADEKGSGVRLLNSLAAQEAYTSPEGKVYEMPEIEVLYFASCPRSREAEEEFQAELANLSNQKISLHEEVREGISRGQAFNLAREMATGDYIAFIDSESRYHSKSTFAKLKMLVEDETIGEGEKMLLAMGTRFKRPEGDGVYYAGTLIGSFCHEPFISPKMDVCLALCAYFIRKDLTEGSSFVEEYPNECTVLYIAELLNKAFYQEDAYLEKIADALTAASDDEEDDEEENEESSGEASNREDDSEEEVQSSEKEKDKFGVTQMGAKFVYFNSLEDDGGYYTPKHDLSWYTDTLKGFYLPYIAEKKSAGEFNLFLQCVVYYMVFTRISCNMNVKDAEQLKGEAITEFWNSLYQITDQLDYRILSRQISLNKVGIYKWFVTRVIEHKIENGKDQVVRKHEHGLLQYEIEDEGNTYIVPLYHTEQEFFYNAKAINYQDGCIVIDLCEDSIPDEYKKQLKPRPWTDCGEVELHHAYNKHFCFGQVVTDRDSYQLRIPVGKDKRIVAKVRVEVDEELLPMNVKFPSARGAKLVTRVPESFWHFGGDKILSFDYEEHAFVIERVNAGKLLERELAFCKAIIADAKVHDDEKKSILETRFFHWNNYFYKNRKPIWITYDKIFKGGDNGEYIYHYIRENCPEVDMYYVLGAGTADYERMKEDKNVLKAGSLRARKTASLAQTILATNVNSYACCGFVEGSYRRYLKDIVDATEVCIQHGLTVQNIESYQNRLRDNTQLYLCASPNEVENLKGAGYDYPEDSIKLCGLARFDGLHNKDEKVILIAPTWRRSVVNKAAFGKQREQNAFFKDTVYYDVYQSLINDEKLIANATKYGYRILYVVHPAVAKNAGDFSAPEGVEILAADGNMSYEEVLTKSSLMITDYSGIQFDFAFMKKPILYYQPDRLPAHFTESESFQYESMGFGPIIKEHASLVDSVCEYMEKECQMIPEYVERAENFFAYFDFDNCKRIYQEVRKFEDQRSAHMEKTLHTENLNMISKKLFDNKFKEYRILCMGEEKE